MASLSMTGNGSTAQIAETLTNKIQGSAFSCELVDSVHHTCGDTDLYVMVFEKYYMRASNRASLTVVVSGSGDTVHVDAIGSGGGQGAVFKLSWGAEDDFVDTVGQILRPFGFR